LRPLRGKWTAHNLIRERDIKFVIAINAEWVLVRHLAGSEVNANMHFLFRLTVWALNRHHHELRGLRHVFPSDYRLGQPQGPVTGAVYPRPRLMSVWAWFNLLIGYLLFRAGRVSPENYATLIVFLAGIITIL
jgi:hypothetical protein